jgi:hypothetical protein
MVNTFSTFIDRAGDGLIWGVIWLRTRNLTSQSSHAVEVNVMDSAVRTAIG